MKKYVKSSSDLEKVYFKLEKPSLKSYRFSGQVDEENGRVWGDVQKLSPYDDADYWWARIRGNGLIEFIYDGKVRDKMQFHCFEEEDYESVWEYVDEMIEDAAMYLKEQNSKISPRMMYD